MILDWIAPITFEHHHRAIIRERGRDTGIWILQHPKFLEWASGKSKRIWCPGIRTLDLRTLFCCLANEDSAGAGKTMISYVLADEVLIGST